MYNIMHNKSMFQSVTSKNDAPCYNSIILAKESSLLLDYVVPDASKTLKNPLLHKSSFKYMGIPISVQKHVVCEWPWWKNGWWI